MGVEGIYRSKYVVGYTFSKIFDKLCTYNLKIPSLFLKVDRKEPTKPVSSRLFGTAKRNSTARFDHIAISAKIRLILQDNYELIT